MKLVIDEHLSPVIAEGLRQRGHDVVSILEVSLAGGADADLLEWSIKVGRAVVTANVKDFRALHRPLIDRGVETPGLVLLSSKLLPTRAAFGGLIEALDAFLQNHPGEHDLACLEHWL